VEPDTDQLLECVGHDDPAARGRLLARHRRRLRELVALRMDPRLLPRVDPSDVLQDALAEADRRLPDYVRRRPMPFYPWLRLLALERLAQLYRRHLRAGKRSVRREECSLSGLPDSSVRELAERLAWGGADPDDRLNREERRRHLHDALTWLGESDREVIVLRHLEQLSVRELATVLGTTEGAVKMRHGRALQRLRMLLTGEGVEGCP
jgi:RNA polymerase sigma-70 factor (ECF subfamily)